jgi:cytochrome c oxidase subunit 1
MQLAVPGRWFPSSETVSPQQYLQLVTQPRDDHDLLGRDAVLIAAFGNFLIPLMVGCDDMVFPTAQPPQLPGLPSLRDHPRRVVLRPAAASADAWSLPPLSARPEYNLTRRLQHVALASRSSSSRS